MWYMKLIKPMRYIPDFLAYLTKKYKSEAYIYSFFEKYKNELNEKINYIFKYNEFDVDLFHENEWEYALPGFEEYLKTGYYKFMLARYMYSIKYIKNKKVLDAGCGLGYGSYLICDYSREIISIDINENALNFAKEKWKSTKLNFKRHSILDLDTLNKKFDVILGFELIEHLTLNDAKKFLEQTFNNLNKGGVLILSSSFPDSEGESKSEERKNKYHKKIYTKNEIKKLMMGFCFKKVNFIGNYIAEVKK